MGGMITGGPTLANTAIQGALFGQPGASSATRATRLPRELQMLYDQLLPLIQKSTLSGTSPTGKPAPSPFVDTAEAPDLVGPTGMEEQLQELLFGLGEGGGTLNLARGMVDRGTRLGDRGEGFVGRGEQVAGQGAGRMFRASDRLGGTGQRFINAGGSMVDQGQADLATGGRMLAGGERLLGAGERFFDQAGAGADRAGGMIDTAFNTAQRFADRPLDYTSISGEIDPVLDPFITNRIAREGDNRRGATEQLIASGTVQGTPIMEQERELKEQTNRDIAEQIANVVLGERGFRGEEARAGLSGMTAGGTNRSALTGLLGQLGTQSGGLGAEIGRTMVPLRTQFGLDTARTGADLSRAGIEAGRAGGELGESGARMATMGANLGTGSSDAGQRLLATLLGPAMSSAALPRNIQTQQYALDQSQASAEQEAIQQVLNLLMGGVSQGNQTYSTQSHAYTQLARLLASIQDAYAKNAGQMAANDASTIGAIGGAAGNLGLGA